MKRRWLGAVAVVACSLAVASFARADGVDLTPPEPRSIALAAEVGFFREDQAASTLHVITPRVALHYAFSAHWSVAGDLGLALLAQGADRGEGDDFALGPSNPTAYALYRAQLGALRYRVGLGGSLPLARIDREGSGRLLRTGYSHAQAMRGLADLWVFAPARGAVLAFGKLEGDLHEEAQFELEFAPALLIPAYEAFGRDTAELFFPTALTLSTSRGPFRLGLRLQAVFMPADDPDPMQLALEPQLRIGLGGSSFFEARYLANLDEPLAGERGPRTWGLHVAAGGAL